MAHEYGHLINKDYLKSNSSLNSLHQKEHLADIRGFELANHYMQTQDAYFEQIILGTCLFFAGVDLLYRTVSDCLNIDFPDPSQSSHPNPIARWQLLMKTIFQNSEDKERTSDSAKLASKFADIIEVIYYHNDSLIDRLKTKKSRISKIWGIG